MRVPNPEGSAHMDPKDVEVGPTEQREKCTNLLGPNEMVLWQCLGKKSRRLRSATSLSRTNICQLKGEFSFNSPGRPECRVVADNVSFSPSLFAIVCAQISVLIKIQYCGGGHRSCC